MVQTLEELKTHKIKNYALGTQDGRYYINVLCKIGDPPMVEFTGLKPENTLEISEKVYNTIFNTTEIRLW